MGISLTDIRADIEVAIDEEMLLHRPKSTDKF